MDDNNNKKTNGDINSTNTEGEGFYNSIHLLIKLIKSEYLAAILVCGIIGNRALHTSSNNTDSLVVIFNTILVGAVIILKTIEYRKKLKNPSTYGLIGEPPAGTMYVPTKHDKPIPIYTFYDLKNIPNFEHPFDGHNLIYQDFNRDTLHPSQSNNMNFIQNMWAASTNNCYIKATTIKDAVEKDVLQVEFNSTKGISNLTIRPYFGIPVKLPSVVNWLVIRARANSISTKKIKGNNGLHVGVRIVNGYFQHWMHGPELLRNTPFEIKDDDFFDIRIPLTGGVGWNLFPSDGNIFYENATKHAEYHENTFKYIMGINLAFGTKTNNGVADILYDGKGVVEISKIYFSI